jgi:hypothetical protein
MSSATSTNAIRRGNHAVPRKGGTYGEEAADDGFRVSHFFVLLSLIAATVAVIMARPAAPANLILISLTIGAAGLAAVAFYRTIAPLVSPGSEEEQEPMSARLRNDLEREKALTLRSIKELEFDRAMGKVSNQDFEVMADRLRGRALGIMKQLDAGDSVYRQAIEKELAARIATTDPKVRPGSQRAAKSDADVRRSATTCTCGTANDADARFCKKCGRELGRSGA